MPGSTMAALLLRVFSELSGSAPVSPVPAEHECANMVACGPLGAPALLLGPPGSRKSGLLFLAAVLAAEEGAVVFLSREPLQEVPRGGRAARDPLILKKIRFVYPPSLKELLQFFSSLHVAPPPSLVLVDGLERYLPPTSSLTDGARISALMLDSVSHLHCGLIVSAVPNAEGSDGPFAVVERYFPNQCRLCPVTPTETKERCFKASFQSSKLEWDLYVEQDGDLRVSFTGCEEEKSPSRDGMDET